MPEMAYRRFHANQWTERASHWLPAGAWQQCVGQPVFTDGEPIWVGVDVGGDKSASAVVWINGAHHVGCEIFHGDAGVLDCIDLIRELAGRYELREVMYDPWRFGQAAQELAQERVSHRVPADRRPHGARLRPPLPGRRPKAPHPARQPRVQAAHVQHHRPPQPKRMANRQALARAAERLDHRALHGARGDGEQARTSPGARVAMITRCLNCGRRTKGTRCPICTRRHDDWQERRRAPERLDMERDPQPGDRTRPLLYPLRFHPTARGTSPRPARLRRDEPARESRPALPSLPCRFVEGRLRGGATPRAGRGPTGERRAAPSLDDVTRRGS